MLYDARQRPQSVYLNDRLFIVYNGDATPSENGKGRAFPMMVAYDPQRKSFAPSTRLGPSSSDSHDSPIIWADEYDYLHVLFGCHKTPGTYLISTQPVGSGEADIEWRQGSQIAPKLSYPCVFKVHGDRELVYYRTEGHTSSWTYRISDDNGRTWSGPKNDVTDLDSKGRLDWSSYQTKLASRDGRFLHVVYTDYDDNKHAPDPHRFYNPRYKELVSNEWKYNLSYLKIDLKTHQVRNADGEILRTPIDIDYSKENCQIWNTEWRGAGVPPAVSIDNKGDPVFLHVLSEQNLSSHRYYYVRREKGRWIQTPICESNHQWNSGCLTIDGLGIVHAYVVVGNDYLSGGYMDGHGGGNLEEWVSKDAGVSWAKLRNLSPHHGDYAGWRFNNVQPVVGADGEMVDGMFLFYGWNDSDAPKAKAFLFHKSGQPDLID